MARLSVILFFLFLFTVNCKKKCPDCEIVPVTTTHFTFHVKIYITDSYVSDYIPDSTTNYGTAPNIFTSSWTYSGSVSNQYFMIRFDYSSLPSSAVIKSAVLTLYADTSFSMPVNPGHYGNGVDSSAITNITSPWNELTVNWNNRPTNTLKNQIKIKPTVTSADSLYLDVTILVKDQLVNGNYGFQVSLLNYTPYQRLFYYSSDEPTYTKLMPKLMIQLQ